MGRLFTTTYLSKPNQLSFNPQKHFWEVLTTRKGVFNLVQTFSIPVKVYLGFLIIWTFFNPFGPFKTGFRSIFEWLLPKVGWGADIKRLVDREAGWNHFRPKQGLTLHERDSSRKNLCYLFNFYFNYLFFCILIFSIILSIIRF